MNIKKTALFKIIVLLIPFLFFLVLELSLQLFQYGGNLDLFTTPQEAEVSHYYIGNPNVSRRYFLAETKLPHPTKDLILKQKPVNGYRIMVLGGSSAAGFPYGNNLMFSRILHRYLLETFPGRTIEMMNLAMTAINSYAFIDLIDEVLEQEPDLILIYAGHNEFYGAMGVASTQSITRSRWLIQSYLALKNFRSFLLLRDLIGRLQLWFSEPQDDKEVHPTATLMERIVSDQVIPCKSDIYQKGLHQFEENLSDVLEKCSEAGVPVILSEVVANLRDQRPFQSVNQEAMSVYQAAQASEKAHAYDRARGLYYQAKDLDALRFRASEDINTIINRLGSSHRCPVVPMKKVFESASPNGLIGAKLMTDHLHPNMEGYCIMASAFVDVMRAKGFITHHWPAAEPVTLDNWGITALDSACADLNIKYLKGGWPFQPKGTENRTLHRYDPRTQAESLAVRVLIDGAYSIESAHVDMAAYFMAREMYEQVYLEYKALLFTIPYEVYFYEEAARMLLKLERYEEALPILEQSLQLRETTFNTKWIGQILLEQDRIEAALPYLEKAEKSAQDDLQLLYNLCRAYIVSGRGEQASQLFNHMKSSYPNSPYLGKLKYLADHMQEKQAVARQYVRAADSLFSANQLQRALHFYQEAHAQVSSLYTIKQIGQIFFMQKRIEEAISVLEKARLHYPLDQEISYNLAVSYFISGRYAEAESELAYLGLHHPGFSDPSHLRERLNATRSR
jgi:tetratricopeptide (TPR) repeat protein